MMMGVLYCSGSDAQRASTFFDVLQSGLSEKISNKDKDFSTLYPHLIKLSTLFIYQYAGKRLGKSISEADEAEEEE